MFYVSNVAGTQLPYDYRTTPISQRLKSPNAVSAVDSIDAHRSGIEPRGVHRESEKPRGHEAYESQLQKKRRREVMYAGDIMSSPVFSLRTADRLGDAAKVFKAHKFRHIPILGENEKLVGILSDRDFFGVALDGESRDSQIEAVMTIDILTARPKTEIREIASIMISRRIGCVPITDKNEELVGILTRSDILRTIVNHAPLELWS